MDDDTLGQKAIERLQLRLSDAGFADMRIHFADIDDDEDEDTGVTYAQCRMTVLEPTPDIVVFYDPHGGLRGWRDDVRLGGDAMPKPCPAGLFAPKMIEQFGLTEDAREGAVKAVELPPVGWTYEGIMFKKKPPEAGDTLKVWANPETFKVIQWLAAEPQDDAVTDPAAQSAHAEDVVRREFCQRLAPLPLTLAPENYFATETNPPEVFGHSHQVRVKTWRHWSDATVSFDREGGTFTGDCIDRLAEPATTESLGAEATEAAIRSRVTLPDGAVFASYRPDQIGEGHHVDIGIFDRDYGGYPVDGDFIEVALHPETGVIVRYDHQWRHMTAGAGAPRITEDAAVAFVEDNRETLGIDEDLEFDEADLRWVNARKRKLFRRASTLAWCLTFSADWGYVIAQVDAATGRVVYIKRSA